MKPAEGGGNSPFGQVPPASATTICEANAVRHASVRPLIVILAALNRFIASVLALLTIAQKIGQLTMSPAIYSGWVEEMARLGSSACVHRVDRAPGVVGYDTRWGLPRAISPRLASDTPLRGVRAT